ncbi:hypothetical protein ACLOJK_041498 [Asimina triloba]
MTRDSSDLKRLAAAIILTGSDRSIAATVEDDRTAAMAAVVCEDGGGAPTVHRARIADRAQQGVGTQTGVRPDPGESGRWGRQLLIRCYKQWMYTGDLLYPTTPDFGKMVPDISVVVTTIG